MIKRYFFLVTAFLPLMVACSVSASGQMVLTTYVPFDDQTEPSILARINPSSGVVTEIGSTGVNSIQSMAFDSSDGTLYAVSLDSSGITDSHYRIDTTTGQGTFVGEIGAIGFLGLAYDADRDKLYATGGSFLPDRHALYEIDRATGAGTPVGPEGTEISTNLAFYPPTEQLFFTSFGSREFWTYDQSTGVQSYISDTTPVLSGMDFDPQSGTLLGLADNTGLPGGFGNKLFSLDPLSGSAQQIATLSRSEFYSSLAIIPTPGGAIVLLIPFGVFGVRRR